MYITFPQKTKYQAVLYLLANMSNVFAFLHQKANCRQNRRNVKWQYTWSFYTFSPSQEAKIIPTLGASHTLFFRPLHPFSDGSLQPVALGVSHPVSWLWLGPPSHYPCPVVLCFSPLCAFQDLEFCNFLLTCSLLPAVTFSLTSVSSMIQEESSALFNTTQVLEQDLHIIKIQWLFTKLRIFK